MSSVRMCDSCKTIFSENDEGWTTFTGTRIRKDKYGDKYTETVHRDACSKCSSTTFQDTPKVIESTNNEFEF